MAKKISKPKISPGKQSKIKPGLGSVAKPQRRVSSLPVPPPINAPDARVLDRLWGVVLSRKDADPALSHSARLLSRGTAKIAQKFGEEAVECLIEAVGGHRTALIGESADVLYHLLVLWVDAGLRPEQIWTELARREGVSGIEEKASRKPVFKSVTTTKIP
jgi:phosphoribosyl-ATP pyrophosphohydrolase